MIDIMNLTKHVWTLDNLELLGYISHPCWLARPRKQEPAAMVKWANLACQQRLGILVSTEKQLESIANMQKLLSSKDLAACTAKLSGLFDDVLRASSAQQQNVDIKQLFPYAFADMKAGIKATLNYAPIRVKNEEGTEEVLVCCQMLEPVPATTLRAAAAVEASAQPSWLLDRAGRPFFANAAATKHLADRGITGANHDLLKKLVKSHDPEKLDQVDEARTTVMSSPGHHQVIQLCMAPPKGPGNLTKLHLTSIKDPASQDLMLSITIEDITGYEQRQLLSLASERRRSRRTTDFAGIGVPQDSEADHCSFGTPKSVTIRDPKRNPTYTASAARTSKTLIDTNTVADKILGVISGILQGNVPSREELEQLQADVCSTEDLRRPVNLAQKLLSSPGMNKEVSSAMTELLQGTHGAASRWNSTIKARARHAEVLTSSEVKHLPTFELQSVERTQSLPSDQSILEAMKRFEEKSGLNKDISVSASVTPVAERLLQEADKSWDFDIFSLADATAQRPLSTLGFFLITRSGLAKEHGLNEEKLANVLFTLEDGYLQTNPYHNRTHAAGVLQIMHLLLASPGGLKQLGVVDSATTLACYLAAICHDHDHPGFNNDFLIKTMDPLALLYNDHSPLENHHVASASAVLLQGSLMGMAQNRDTSLLARAATIELVLGTDMKKHFNILSLFQTHFNALKAAAPETGGCPVASPMNKLTPEQRLLATQMALKVADLGHTAATERVHLQWTKRLEAEFYTQGDKERELGLTVSPLMDRTIQTGISKSQVGFFEIVAMPLVTRYVEVFPVARPLLNSLTANFGMWARQLQAAQAVAPA
ncbi:hypothetical protein WJX84_001089 [Apatococcus fuscideae]|uniref:PDEase domain-containing protein n=1 Tax=Apatococcus fuscideae TaxID=2026836 RepID=A0AAW1SQ27_9CHLO